MTHRSIEQAETALQEVVIDVTEDMGEEAVEAGWRDLVYVVADNCTSDVRAALLRRHGF